MQRLDLTLATAAENVALDEALLDEAEEGRRTGEVLRLWELDRPAVIIGRSSALGDEVDFGECRRQGIDVVRRSSGGAAIVAGPGCLMFSLVLSYHARPALRFLDQAHQFVLSRLATALGSRLAGVEHCGTSDLAWQRKKFSGNSLRCKRNWCLYHGTLLYALELASIARLLQMPPRQPEYRQGRAHDAFVTNLPLARSVLVQAAIEAFAANEQTSAWPREETQRLVHQRYGREDWTRQR